MNPFKLAPLSDDFARALARATGRKIETRSLPALVERVSRKYLGEQQSLAKPDELAARALFFLPRDLHKVVAPIAELSRAGLVPRRPLRVLDVGAGVGASALGALMALSALGHSVARVRCVDDDREALSTLRKVFDALRSDSLIDLAPSALSVGEGSVDAANNLGDPSEAGSPWDLILVSNVLTEVLRREDARSDEKRDEQARAERVAELLRSLIAGAPLAEDGALLLIEPATHEDARVLQRARTLLEEGPAPRFVFAPCTHGQPCPLLTRERDWCHDDVDVDLPAWLHEVARGAGLRYQGLTYSYLTVRSKPGRLQKHSANEGWVSARMVSAVRDTKGKREAFLCCQEKGDAVEPREPLRAMQLDRAIKRADEATPKLADCSRGELVAIAPALLPDEGRTVRLGADDWER
ncbi:MAG: small ribosomal subunit Rsm22 family protein [Polyangiales bacterium]